MPEETVAQERIAVALIGLLNEKPLDRISITEITEKAGVSRVSYYRHFSSKEDVLTQHAEYVLESVYVDMKSGKLCNAYDFWKRIYHDLGESCLVSSMQKADLQNSFFRSLESCMAKIFSDIMKIDLSDKRNVVLMEFVIGGFTALLWKPKLINNSITDDDIADFIKSLGKHNGFFLIRTSFNSETQQQ